MTATPPGRLDVSASRRSLGRCCRSATSRTSTCPTPATPTGNAGTYGPHDERPRTVEAAYGPGNAFTFEQSVPCQRMIRWPNAGGSGTIRRSDLMHSAGNGGESASCDVCAMFSLSTGR